MIDIRTPFRTVMKRVYFANPARFAANTPPFVTPVLRPVLPGAPATGVMDRLFAGPTPNGAGSRAAAAAVRRDRLRGAVDSRLRSHASG